MENVVREYKLTFVPNDRKPKWNNTALTDPEMVAKFAVQLYDDTERIFESMHMLMLDRANKPIGWVKLSQGGIDSSIFDLRIAAKYAIESLAVGVILIHNHPSGSTKASESDRVLTEKASKGFKLLDIKLLDHIIICPNDNGYETVSWASLQFNNF